MSDVNGAHRVRPGRGEDSKPSRALLSRREFDEARFQAWLAERYNEWQRLQAGAVRTDRGDYDRTDK